jgi:Putative prokaryotic signal transducing protein
VKRVYRAASLFQVAHARNLLVTAGIDCEIHNQYLAGAMGELPLMETWPQLMVADADEARSLKVLERASAPASGAPWICESCGERLEAQFTHCWRCGADVSR